MRGFGILKSMKRGQNKNGFTIVELLIVIVVIGILAAITAVAFNGIQSKGRDAIRVGDAQSIVKALEIHKSYTGSYPVHTSVDGDWETSIEDGGAPAFLETLRGSGAITGNTPVDPANVSTPMEYAYKYHRYNPGNSGCDASRGSFYVLGVTQLDGVPGTGRPNPSSPGFSCSGRNWGLEFDWVTGSYEN